MKQPIPINIKSKDRNGARHINKKKSKKEEREAERKRKKLKKQYEGHNTHSNHNGPKINWVKSIAISLAIMLLIRLL